jgi:endonuclease/exonuclease/phosphatase family metal-dependent hydrolase
MSGREFHVLYQNMTLFGGGSVARNRAFTSGFSQIALGSAANRVLVAGFTEIGNAGPAVSALTALAANIDDTLQGSYTIAVGLSATGLIEYAYLATYAEDAANTFHVDGYGKVIGTQDETQWTCYPAATLASATLPADLTPGSRGLAYVTGTIVSGADPSWQGKQLAVLFTHGMYGTGDVYGGMQRLPGAVAAVYAAHKLPATVGYVLAGDFNASPRPVSASGTSLAPVFAADTTGKPVSTTQDHAYDFFFTSPALSTATATAWPQTRSGPALSQHAAISLQLSPQTLT